MFHQSCIFFKDYFQPLSCSKITMGLKLCSYPAVLLFGEKSMEQADKKLPVSESYKLRPRDSTAMSDVVPSLMGSGFSAKPVSTKCSICQFGGTFVRPYTRQHEFSVCCISQIMQVTPCCGLTQQEAKHHAAVRLLKVSRILQKV